MSEMKPVAWLHEDRKDSAVITAAVKGALAGAFSEAAPSKYSIPLYTRPALTAEQVREIAEMKDLLGRWLEYGTRQRSRGAAVPQPLFDETKAVIREALAMGERG